MCNLNLPWCSFIPFPWVLSLSPERRDQCFPLCSLHEEAVGHDAAFPSVSSLGWKKHVISDGPHIFSPLGFSPSLVPSFGHSDGFYVLLILWYPKMHTVLKVRPHQCRIEWGNQSLYHSCAVLDALRMQLTLWLPGHTADSYSTCHWPKRPDPFLYGCLPASCPSVCEYI